MPRQPRVPSIPLLVWFAWLPLLALLLVACGGANSSAGGGGAAVLPEAAAPLEAAAAATSAPATGAAQEIADVTTSSAPAGAPPAQPVLGDPNRKIIKNATLSIEVSSVIGTLSRLGSDAAALGGYVIETRTDYQEGAYAQRATLSMGVPVEQFEPMLQRVREAATQVWSEQASGTDVTEEFVDVQSQIANLEATQARVREFLAQATTVEESLQVNARLSELEGQLSQLKGRLQYLSQRAAFSTITVELQQVPGPVAEPTPETVPWSAGETAREAYATLSVIGQGVATIAIWLLVVGLPLALPVLLVVLVGRVALERMLRRSRNTPPVVAAPETK